MLHHLVYNVDVSLPNMMKLQKLLLGGKQACKKKNAVLCLFIFIVFV